MSSGRINVNPSGLSSEINTHRNRNNSVRPIRYSADVGSLNLRSVSELRNCLGRLDLAMTRFNGIVDRDIDNLERARSEFLRSDSQAGGLVGRLLSSSGTIAGGTQKPNVKSQGR